MLVPATTVPIALDVTTLFVVATCLTGLLGLLLLASARDRIVALAWWGTAHLIGGLSVVAWSLEGRNRPARYRQLVHCLRNMWNAARLFHGRPVIESTLNRGWRHLAHRQPIRGFCAMAGARVVLSAHIFAIYAARARAARGAAPPLAGAARPSCCMPYCSARPRTFYEEN